MRKLFILFCFSLLISNQSFAQTWTRLQSWGLDLEAIFWVNDSVAFSGGENLLIKTSDYGQTWEELQNPGGRIKDLFFLDSDTGIAVGENSLFLKTQDGGTTWTSRSISEDLLLYSVSFNEDQIGLMVGEGGAIFQSVDKGETWQLMESGTNNDLFSVLFQSSDTVFAAGENGTILKSYDQGASWESLNTGVGKSIWSVEFSSDLTGYAVGADGLALKTLDGGESWQPLVTHVTASLHSVAISKLNSNIILAVGEQATALKSTNAGASFSKINLGATNERKLNHVDFVGESNRVFAVGIDGYVISSTNAGSNYTQRLGGIRNDFSSIDFKNDRLGFIAGQRGDFYITSNFGQTIISRPIPEEEDIVAIDFWNGNFGYVSGASGKVYRTSNGGRDWGDFSINTLETVMGYYLFAPSVLYVSGTNGLISRSFDSGVTWDSEIDSNTNLDLKDLLFFDFIEGIAIGENGQILYSYGGNTWEIVEPVSNENFNGLSKLSGESAVMVGDNGVIVKTEDMGKTFELIDSGVSEDLLSVDFFDDEFGFVSGRNGTTLVTRDGGNTWAKIETGTSRDLYSISAGTPSIAYATGDDGTILRYNCVPAEGALSEISGATQTCLERQFYSITDQAIAGTQLFWRVDGGEIVSGQGSNSIEVRWEDAGRKGVFVDRRNFCGAGETSYMEVIVSDLPSPDQQISGNGAVCENIEEEYSLPDLDGVNYTWSVSGGEITQGQGTSKLKVHWTTPGSGSLTAVPENFCGKSAPITLPVTITPLPDQPSEIIGESLIGVGEQTYSIEEVEEVTYQWVLSGGGYIVEGQGTATVRIVWEEEGDFVLEVKAQNSCDFGESRSLAVKISFITGIEPSPDIKGLKVFPNPSQGKFQVESDALDTWSSAVLINSIGQVILEKTILAGQKRLVLQDLKPGVYFLRLEGNQGFVTRKLIVH